MSNRKFEDFLDTKCYKSLLRFAFNLVKDQEKAKDLVQDACYKIYKYYKDNDLNLSLFFTTIKNCFINDYRKKVRWSEREKDIIQLFDRPEYIEDLDERDLVNNILIQNNELSYYILGYKYEEISEIFNLPLGTIKSRIFFQRKEILNNTDMYRKPVLEPLVKFYNEIPTGTRVYVGKLMEVKDNGLKICAKFYKILMASEFLSKESLKVRNISDHHIESIYSLMIGQKVENFNIFTNSLLVMKKEKEVVKKEEPKFIIKEKKNLQGQHPDIMVTDLPVPPEVKSSEDPIINVTIQQKLDLIMMVKMKIEELEKELKRYNDLFNKLTI